MKAELTAKLDDFAAGKAMPFAAALKESLVAPLKTKAERRGVPEGIALGVLPGKTKDDFKLAVRLQSRDLAATAFAHYAAGAAREEADVRFIGAVRPLSMANVNWDYLRTVVRPLTPGCSLGHWGTPCGTLGLIVKDLKGRVGVLSNNHIVGAMNYATVGDPVLQPGIEDKGDPEAHTVAVFERAIHLVRDAKNLVDAAWARMAPGVPMEPRFDGRPLRGIVPTTEVVGQKRDVWKLGRTTGLTCGTAMAREVDAVTVDYFGFYYQFDDQIEIVSGPAHRFADKGDSGAVILTAKTDLGLGLLFSVADNGYAYANPIDSALGSLSLAPA